ncbi:MAG: JAB domain-containing protein [Verrucomicrobia bacterium]|jgi:DNA repair protein RadC|nr:MAG: JAB domain-containing protein [Verrucomicrobiota bacterium]MDH4470489.1 DNA repair protein RadC [Verrucomicrobiae bacterium]
MNSLKEKSFSKKDLPRERIAAHGAEALHDTELLAIFLRTGRVGHHVLEVADELIKEWGTLRRLAGCSIEELSQISGIGPAKAAELKAAFEMGKRIAAPEKEKISIVNGEDIYNVMKSHLLLLPYESLWVLLLDTRGGLMEQREIFRGSLSQTVAHPREIFQLAIVKRAYAIAIAHNHPSGDPTPSRSDRLFTNRLIKAGECLQLPLADHVIIGSACGERQPYFSFREAGLI